MGTGLPAPHRPLPVRLLNGIGRASQRAHVPLRGLEESRLLAAARRQARLEDFGATGFEEPFRVLLADLEEHAGLSALGRIFARRQMLEILVARLQMVEHRKHDPAVDEERIDAPIFVLGLPRTGTTLLHGLLAQDPAHRAPISWECDDPGTPATPDTFATDPRIEKTRKRFAQLNQLAPGFQTVHPIGTQMPQECIVITAHDFWGVRFEMCFDVPRYTQWMLADDGRRAYRFHRWFLQHLQSGGVRGRWVLKTPGHLGTIDALLHEYPDARIIQLHRDPIKVIPSVASLEYHMRSISTDHQSADRLGATNLALWSEYLNRGLDARDRHPDKSGQFLDFHYAELVADPMGCVRRIYDHFDMRLGDTAMQRMQRFMADNPQNKHGKHHYSLGMFGLERERVKQAFERYCQRFGVENEG